MLKTFPNKSKKELGSNKEIFSHSVVELKLSGKKYYLIIKLLLSYHPV